MRFLPRLRLLTWAESARSITLLLSILFVFLLWKAIEIGSLNSNLQRVAAQISSFESAWKDAQIQLRRTTQTANAKDADEGAKLSLENAASDVRDSATAYLAAVCDAGARLKDIGSMAGSLALLDQATECQSQTVNLQPGESRGTSSRVLYVQTVKVGLEYYTTLATTYLLPILFGMLGALVFTLRDVVKSPANTGEFAAVTGYVLRVLLGAIFGLIIGYVNISSTPNAGIAASPLLFSLVAGFATDAVISLLERIASLFDYREPSPDAAPKSSAQP